MKMDTINTAIALFSGFSGLGADSLISRLYDAAINVTDAKPTAIETVGVKCLGLTVGVVTSFVTAGTAILIKEKVQNTLDKRTEEKTDADPETETTDEENEEATND